MKGGEIQRKERKKKGIFDNYIAIAKLPLTFGLLYFFYTCGISSAYIAYDVFEGI